MLKLGTKCWISAFNAQGSRGIIVAVQVGAVKMYVAEVEALRKNESRWKWGTIKASFKRKEKKWDLLDFGFQI